MENVTNLDLGERGADGSGPRFESLHIMVGPIQRGEMRLEKLCGQSRVQQNILLREQDNENGEDSNVCMRVCVQNL